MFPFRKILFPIDYSELCEAVVPYVKEMVERYSADLTLVHAYGAEALAYTELALVTPALADEARTREEQRLDEFARKIFPGRDVEFSAEMGEAGSVIHKVVQHQGTDLVMLATHGRGPIRNFLLGSVAAKVLHDISAAVWTGTGFALSHHTPQIPYKAVLCAVDDSDEAETVLTAAAAFALNYQARLWLIQVIEMPPAPVEVDFTPYKKDIMDAADSRLRELKTQLGIDARHAVIDGRVASAVGEEAVRRKADLIIIGRGRVQDTFSRLWSHAYPVIRESPCPVLSI